MKTQLGIENAINNGKIEDELEYERCLLADRKLRVLSNTDKSFKPIRKKLRDLIEKYEKKHWSKDSDISEEQLRESDIAEEMAEHERQFIERRKTLIKQKLKKHGLNQQEFGLLLGHGSKSYTSELVNGISPFSLRDIVVINRLLGIELELLVPTFLHTADRMKIKASIEKLDKPGLKLSKTDFALE